MSAVRKISIERYRAKPEGVARLARNKGERIVIYDADGPVAMIVPYTSFGAGMEDDPFGVADPFAQEPLIPARQTEPIPLLFDHLPESPVRRLPTNDVPLRDTIGSFTGRVTTWIESIFGPSLFGARSDR
jgi:antitoxin (DNA-binding transcriptional repressor) of toxin-antitoxin stability system